MIDKTKLDLLLNDIRSCRDCESSGTTPFVYGSQTSKIFVLSKVPLKDAFDKDKGKEWIDGIPINKYKGTPFTLCKWLKLEEEEANKRLFWIQRTNCAVSFGWNYAATHCSFKFISRAISLVRPKLIITIGREAADWFKQFDNLEDIVGEQNLSYIYEGNKYPWVAFPHTSGQAVPWRSAHKSELDKAIERARSIIH